jgi:uncharacterized membrane protein YedE/YeeE
VNVFIVALAGRSDLKVLEQFHSFCCCVSSVEARRVRVYSLRPELGRLGQAVVNEFSFADLLFWLVFVYLFFWRHIFLASYRPGPKAFFFLAQRQQMFSMALERARTLENFFRLHGMPVHSKAAQVPN